MLFFHHLEDPNAMFLCLNKEFRLVIYNCSIINEFCMLSCDVLLINNKKDLKRNMMSPGNGLSNLPDKK